MNNNQQERFTGSSTVDEIRTDPVFGSYGRLLFPVDEWYWSGDTLEDLSFVWYSDMDADCTVEIVNTLYARAAAGETVFYDIYSEEEKAEDPAKEDTGLFFFKGEAGARFAVCNAGGGFAYVGAMQDSFPHALELSKRGYNAFALIYRPGAQTACEDLARAISFIFEHAQELQVNTDGYSLWGGSAGGRMAAWLGNVWTAHVCLCRRKRRHCQLAYYEAAPRRHERAGHSYGISPLSGVGPWLWAGYRYRGRRLNRSGDCFLGAGSIKKGNEV